ncbi:MAG: lysylphosphatidylglycerol synthase transmembrane domain-containing protein [Bdellovibrionales bacterium]
MASKAKGYLSIVLKVAVAAALITFMVKSGHLDPKELWSLMTPFNVVMALLLCGMNTLMAAWRWVLLLKARGFDIGVGYGFSLSLIGMFFNHALPGAVGGDLVRGYYLVADNRERKVDSVLSIVIDRVLGLYSFFLLSLIAVAFDFNFVMSHDKIRWVALLCFAIFTGMTVFFTIAFSERLSHKVGIRHLASKIRALAHVLEAFHMFGKNRKTIAASVLVSIIGQIFTMIFFYQVAVISGETDITWNAVLFAVPMGFVVTAVPIAPAGIGVGQVAFHYLFETYLAKPTSFGTTAITAFQLAVVCWAVVGAFFYLRRKRPAELNSMTSAMEAEASS